MWKREKEKEEENEADGVLIVIKNVETESNT